MIQSRAHGTVPPFHSRSALGIRGSLVHAVWIIDDNVVATFSRSGRHGHYDSVSGAVIFETLLLILICPQLELPAPAVLIPVRLNQTAALHAVPRGEWFTIAAEQPPGLRMINPHPRGPEHGRQQ